MEPTDDKMFEAREFPRLAVHMHCAACSRRAEVHIIATRYDGECKTVRMCKSHMLDPGPLLDW